MNAPSTGKTERKDSPSVKNTERAEQSDPGLSSADSEAPSTESSVPGLSKELGSNASQENLVQPQYNYVPESSSNESYVPSVAVEEQKPNENIAQEQPAAQSSNTVRTVAVKDTVSEDAADKQSKPVESKTVESAKPSAKPSESNVAKENAKTAESAETAENDDVQDRPANETDEKISDTESEKPQAQASATAENKSSGNMLSTIMLGVLGVLTISGASAAGVTFMRHRRAPKA